MTNKKVIKAYNKLDNFRGSKERAALIHGISGQYFRQLLASDKTKPDTLMQLHQAIKQSAKEAIEKLSKIEVEISK